MDNRRNPLMKTLTMITNLPAPRTLIAGIHGMNVDHMPEMMETCGHRFSLLLMAAVAALHGWWVARRGWCQDWTGQQRR